MKIKKIFYWILFVFWLVLIFYLSSQPGKESAELSGLFVFFIQTFFPTFVSSFIIRKCAHFSLYFVLSIIVWKLLQCYKFSGFRLFLYSFLFCIFYAITDEVHQLFVLNRSGNIIDICIDSFGSLLGISFCYIMNRILFKLHTYFK